jgi:hypothetical protein
MGLNLAPPSHNRTALNLDERTYERVVADAALVQVGRLHDHDTLTERDFMDARAPPRCLRYSIRRRLIRLAQHA